MNVIIASCSGLSEIRLTTDTHRSRSGVPVLLVGDDTFRPSDMVEIQTGTMVAASLVHRWAVQPERTAEEKEGARRYLSQWRNGPQLD